MSSPSVRKILVRKALTLESTLWHLRKGGGEINPPLLFILVFKSKIYLFWVVFFNKAIFWEVSGDIIKVKE